MSKAKAALVNRLLTSAAIFIPPSIYFLDNFYSIHVVKDNSMAPPLQKKDVVLVRKSDFLPYYFTPESYNVEDVDGTNGSLDEEKLDMWRGINLEEKVATHQVGLFTMRKSPPFCLPGDIVAFLSPENCKHTVETARLVGMGGQRVRPRTEYNKIVKIPPYHFWAESENVTESKSITLSKKLMVGKVERVIWPPARCRKIERLRPPVGRAWWP